MRRSGITSRSKCANFSISQISCSSAGPRRPAVMMLVLSATGDPVALVNRVVVMIVFLGWSHASFVRPGVATDSNNLNVRIADRLEGTRAGQVNHLLRCG